MMGHRSFRKIAGVSLFVWLMVLSAESQSASPRFAVSTARVAQAIAQAGVRVKPSQIDFLLAASSASSTTRLQVVRIARWTKSALKVSLRCRSNVECLPFYVVVRDQTISENELPVIAKNPQPPVVRGGQLATLVFQTENMQITLPVVCLQNGILGERIRVASPDRKQKFEAEVLEAGLLKKVL
ncbi:MAG: flagella basal body P-ring formation protein FlgA [Terriglobales bacterium]